MGYQKDNRVVMTLDAGGTNLVFTAVKGNIEIIEPLVLPSAPDHLEKCLDAIVEGLKTVDSKIPGSPVAIGLAFPGPADYPNGVIGDLYNLPAFRGGVALGPMLADIFGIPVFVNNDGNLFALGEAIAGFLPWVNGLLADHGSVNHYRNLFGVTLGTGFGGGIVIDDELVIGDNSAAGEICLIRHKYLPNAAAEEGANIRAVKQSYAELSSMDLEKAPDPKSIYQIAIGEKKGNRQAAITAFERLGEVAGDALANTATLIDGLIVIGGGLSGAHSIILPAIIKELNATIGQISRLQVTAFNLEDQAARNKFMVGQERRIRVPKSDRRVTFDGLKRIGVGISKLGTGKAVAIGAYTFALKQLDKAQLNSPL